MKNSYPKICLTILAIAGLTACGGGGGGGSASTAFVSWGSIQPGTTIVASGDSQEGTYTWNSNPYPYGTVTSLTAGSQQQGATFTETFDSNGYASSVRIKTASTDITFTRGVDIFVSALSINSNFWAVESSDGTKYALMLNPNAIGWSYQSFGTWVTGAGTGSGRYGAASVGSPTPASSVPSTGSAIYYGYAGGRFVDTGGDNYFTLSYMQSTVNFGTRQVAFTTGYTEQSPDLVSSSTNSGLPMTGTLTYSPGSNQFSGNVTTVGGVMSGTATGRFYGPSAQEIGGTFSLTGPLGSGYSGAFGGAQ